MERPFYEKEIASHSASLCLNVTPSKLEEKNTADFP